jgi:hypothetical protein
MRVTCTSHLIIFDLVCVQCMKLVFMQSYLASWISSLWGPSIPFKYPVLEHLQYMFLH